MLLLPAATGGDDDGLDRRRGQRTSSEFHPSTKRKPPSLHLRPYVIAVIIGSAFVPLAGVPRRRVLAFFPKGGRPTRLFDSIPQVEEKEDGIDRL
mmetsp:Transcript_50861/g.94118  ORF Transcript_50861/g.94118 Transcript_50861/m.94118 type:complete len:95 (-) Transcript_50861:940-1224(-)